VAQTHVPQQRPEKNICSAIMAEIRIKTVEYANSTTVFGQLHTHFFQTERIFPELAHTNLVVVTISAKPDEIWPKR
jgi:hypothetical protein